jgi:zinc protease
MAGSFLTLEDVAGCLSKETMLNCHGVSGRRFLCWLAARGLPIHVGLVLLIGVLGGCPHPQRIRGKLPKRKEAPVIHVLDNGLRVLLQENHAAPVVAIQMWVNTGSADDPDELSGLAHVLEHMVFKGTAKRGEGEIAMEIEGAGGQINAWTSFDQTVFHVVIASRYFRRGLEIVSDTLQNARFDPVYLERELQVIGEEIKQGEDSPTRVVSRNLFGTAYRRHPYRRPVIGKAHALGSMTREKVKRYFNRWYSPQNMTLVVVGDFKSASAIEKVRKLFTKKANRTARGRREVEPAQRRMRVTVQHRETQEAYISMAFHIPGMMDDKTPALDLAAVILGQGESSRLTRKVKHELQTVTTSYAYAYTPKDPGLLVVGATCTPGKLLKAISALAAEAIALGATEVSAAELQRAKTLVESDAVYQKETVQGQARKLGFYQVVAGNVDFEQTYSRRTLDVTPRKLRQIAARYLHPRNLSISVITPGGKGREEEISRDITDAVRIAGAQALASGGQEIRGERTVKYTLPNGARLLVRRDSTVPLAAVRAVWQGGLRYETRRNNGVNSLLAALMTRGTKTRTANQINEAIEGMAGSIGGFSGQNSFGLRSEFLARHWEQGLEILSDCLVNPAFAAEEVERERRSLIDDILAQDDDPGSKVMRLFNRTLFKKHPYRLEILGSVASVSSITRDQLVAYHQRHFQPSNMVLAIVGDVDVERVKARFKQLFGAAPRRVSAARKVKSEPARTSPEEVMEFAKKQQAHIVVGYPGTKLRSKDRYVLEVLSTILSGQGGRLFISLRDQQGLAYHVGAYSQEGLDPGYFAVYVASSPENIQAVLTGIEKQLSALRERQVKASELKRVQRYLVGGYEISLQRRSTVASYLAFNECYGMGFKAYRQYSGAILDVTAQDIQRVARRYLNLKQRVVAIVRPEERSPGAAKRLRQPRQAGTVDPKAKQPKRRRGSKKKKAR